MITALLAFCLCVPPCDCKECDCPGGKSCLPYCACKDGGPCYCNARAGRSYDDARAEALRDHKPLVVFVGCPALPVKGAVVSSGVSFDWQKKPGVVVGVYQPGYLEWVTTLPPTASARDVEIAISRAPRREWVAPMPTFIPSFTPSFGRGGRSC